MKLFSTCSVLKLPLFALLFLFPVWLFAQSNGVLIDYVGTTRDASAVLDVRSSSQGFLAPRVVLTATNAAGPISSPADGLMVYNTATAGVPPNNVTPGYYYWEGSWKRFLNTVSTSVAGSGTLNYIPKWTPDGITLGNSQLFDDGANVGIGTASPGAKLDIVGGTHSFNTGFGQTSTTTGVKNYANFSGDNHGGLLVGANLYSNSGVLYNAKTHSSLAGAGIFLPGNNQTRQGGIDFYTKPTGSVSADAAYGTTPTMVLTSGGSLGIGTVSPQNTLHVNGGMRWGGDVVAPYVYSNVDANGLYMEQVGTSTANSKIRIQSSPSGSLSSYAQFNVDPVNGFSFMSSAGGNSGNVGIGVTSPSAKLDIGGNSQSSPRISARTSGAPSFEFGHVNQAGYGSSIGATEPSGRPYVAFNAESEAAGNTFKTRGIVGRVMSSDLAGGLLFSRVVTANAGGQALTTDVKIDGSGNLNIAGLTANSGVYTDGSKNLTSTIPSSGNVGFWTRNGNDLYPTDVADFVGVGNTNPTAPLDVTGGFPVMRLNDDTNSGETGIRFRTKSSGGSNAHADISWTATGSETGNLVFRVPYTDERMRIQSNGNVGIGTPAPVAKLEVEGPAANWNETTPGLSVGSIHLDPGSTSANIGSAITWGAHDTGSGDNAQAGIYVRSNSSYGTKMYFGTTNSYAAGSKTRMMIDDLGKVGIGVTAPIQALDVVGDINTSTGYRVGNSATTGEYLRGNGTRFVSSAIQASDVPTLNQNTTGYANEAYYLRSPYPYNINITDATTAATLSEPNSRTSVNMHASHGIFGNYGTTLTMSGYDRYGAFQLSGHYNGPTPRLAIRNYVQSTSTWNSWLELITTGNLPTIGAGSFIVNGTGSQAGANFNIGGYGYATSYFQSPTMYVGGLRMVESGARLQTFSTGNSSGGFDVRRNDGSRWGYFYADVDGIGVLNGGGGWAIRSGGAVDAVNTSVSLFTSSLERVRVDASGNMGIGETSPQQKLHVAGGTEIEDAAIEGNSSTRIFRNLLSNSWPSSSYTGVMIIQTNVPQDDHTMTQTWINWKRVYSSGVTNNEILLSGYWSTEGNGGFSGLGYTSSGGEKLRVRMMRNSTTGNVAIVIGETTTTWSHPNVAVTKMSAHYTVSDAYANGWTVSIGTDLSGYINSDDVPDVTSGSVSLYSQVYDVSGSSADVSSTTGSFSTASNSAIQITGSTITITPGKWLIHANAEVYHNSYSYGVKIGLHDITGDIWHAFTSPTCTSSRFVPWHTMVEVTVLANTTYQIKMGRSISDGTSYARNVRLSAHKL